MYRKKMYLRDFFIVFNKDRVTERILVLLRPISTIDQLY